MSKFILDAEQLTEMQIQTLMRIIELRPKETDIHCRKNGKDYQFEADFIKYMRYEGENNLNDTESQETVQTLPIQE